MFSCLFAPVPAPVPVRTCPGSNRPLAAKQNGASKQNDASKQNGAAKQNEWPARIIGAGQRLLRGRRGSND
jgi:hypothetical protein